MASTATADRTDTFASLFGSIVDNVSLAIRGKRDTIELATLALISQGHILLEDAPGLGKTSLAKALSRSLGVAGSRIQFTPDLLPSDVIGTSIWNRSTSEFEFRRGPIFSHIILADEINRAAPKTQSALLEAMAEQQISVNGETYKLDAPFMVIATQNPLDQEGTYPLPESQLDRFLFRVSLGYPDRRAELDILEQQVAGSTIDQLKPVVSSADIGRLSQAITTVHVAPAVRNYLLDIADATRKHPSIKIGLSPRAMLAWQRAAQGFAAASGRSFVTPDDVKVLAHPIASHRLALTLGARSGGETGSSLLDGLLSSVPVPTLD